MRSESMQRTTEHLARARARRAAVHADNEAAPDPLPQETDRRPGQPVPVQTRAHARVDDARRHSRDVVAKARASRAHARSLWDGHAGEGQH